jgi:LmeA-like phospholipid-binding
MSTDPTQPMSPPASAGSGWPEQPEPQQREVPEPPGPGQPPQGQPAQPSFTPAQPSFSPAQPSSPPAQPGQQQGQPGSWEARPGSQEGQAPRQDGWQQQPQYGPQPGWPPDGDGDNGTPGPSGRRRWRSAGQGGYPGAPGGPPPRRRRRSRRWTMTIFALIVVVILLVIGDRVALAVAENDMADQFVSNGLPVKPSVTIEGFPFLTQLVARDLRQVNISASNIPAGPVTITSAKGTLTGMHFNSSFNGATVDHMTVTLFVSFSALAGAGGLGNMAGITVTPAGPDLLKITASVGGVLSDTEEAKVTQTGPQQISVQVLNNGGALGGVLSSFGSFTFSLPKGVPASLRITGITLNAQGLTVTAAANDANLSEPSS